MRTTAVWKEGSEGGGWAKAKRLIGVNQRKQLKEVREWRQRRDGSCEVILKGIETKSVMKKLRRLATERHAWASHLRKVSMYRLMEYWTTTNEIEGKDRVKIRKVLRGYQRRGYNLPSEGELTVKIGMTKEVEKREIFSLLRGHIIDGSALSEISKRYLKENSRVVMRRGKTVESVLANHYKSVRNYHKTECAGLPWCEGDVHFGALMRDIPGKVGEVGKLASNAVLWDGQEDTRNGILRGLAKYTWRVRLLHERWNSLEDSMRWNEHRNEIVLQTQDKRKKINEKRMGWIWKRYSTNCEGDDEAHRWATFKTKLMEEVEKGGWDWNFSARLRRKIVEKAKVKHHCYTNVWEAWMEVQTHGGARMRGWGGQTIDNDHTVVVCRTERMTRRSIEEAERRWKEKKVTVMIVINRDKEEKLRRGWEILGEKEGKKGRMTIQVLGKEEIEEWEELKRDAARAGFDGRNRREHVQEREDGAGEVTLRIAMAPWGYEKTDEIIRELDTLLATRQGEEEERIALSKVMRAKGTMQGLTIGPVDKGGKTMWVECPVPHMGRIDGGMLDTDYYREVDRTEEEIMEEMRTDYEACGLARIAPWGEGDIPGTAAMAKMKALKEKSRILNSYAKVPARRALRKASKALQWIFKQMPTCYHGFTLHSVTDAKGRIMAGNEKILKGAGTRWKMMIEQNDVVRMFTNLGKGEILRRVIALLEDAERMIQGRGGRSRCVTLIMDGKDIIDVRWGRDRTNSDNVTFTFEQILLAVEFDLAHNYCRVGDKILEQIEGCPIGGLLSALYANIYCAYDERIFMKRWEHVADHYYAIRQMDDMLMVIRWDPEDEKTQDEVLKMRKDVGDLYTGGPETEREGKIMWMGKETRVWAGLQLRVEETGVVCKTHNKNEESLEQGRGQRFPRYTQGYSWQADEMRGALMTGNASRLRSQCMLDHDFVHCLELDYWECLLVGTKWSLVEETLKKLPQMTEGTRSEWKEVVRLLKRRLRGRMEEEEKRGQGLDKEDR